MLSFSRQYPKRSRLEDNHICLVLPRNLPRKKRGLGNKNQFVVKFHILEVGHY